MASTPPKRKMSAGSYAAGTAAQLQGPGGNQSQADLEMMRSTGANQGAAVRQVLPVGNQSYQDFQRTRKSPQGQADKAAYEASNRLDRLTDADYQQRRFNEGAGQLRKAAQASPGSSVFAGAPLEAAQAGNRDRAVRLGNYADTNGRAATAGSLADRSSKMNAQDGYAAPGMAMSGVSKDMGNSTPMKKKMTAGPPIAAYEDGAKKVKAGRMAQDEEANELATPSRMPAVTAPDPASDPDTDGSLTARKMRAVPQELPAERDAAPKKATDYKEAAAVLRSDKALMAQYHAGVASGKAFSMSIGGKTFKYAATPQKKAAAAPEQVTGLPGGDLRRARMEEADEMTQVGVQKMTAKGRTAAKTAGTALNATTSAQLLREDDENAAIRKQVRKMTAKG